MKCHMIIEPIPGERGSFFLEWVSFGHQTEFSLVFSLAATSNFCITLRSAFDYRLYHGHFAGLNRALWGGRPPWGGDLIAVQIKQMWYVGNVTMTAISIAVGIGNLVLAVMCQRTAGQAQ